MQKRLLVLFPGSLGDLLCFLPALRFIRDVNPGCQIEFAVRGDGRPLADRLPEVARTLPLESSVFAKLFSPQCSFSDEEAQIFTSVDEILSWFGHARPEINAVLRQIGATHIRSFPFFSGQEASHAITYYLRCVGGSGLQCPWLMIGPGEQQWLDSYWKQQGWDVSSRLLILHPGSGGKKKRWASEGFTHIARWWAAQRNAKVLIMLGPAEEYEVADWRLVGHTESSLSVWQAAALLSRAVLYVGNDSGISHLAGAVGARGVVLFGPTQSSQWRPLGGALVVLQNLSYRSEHPEVAGIALTEITVEEVVATLARMGA